MASISRRFITVEELEEQRRQRLEAGKEAEDDTPYDPRCLFDQLQAQKDEKQRVMDEKRAFKNQVRGLNEEETQFLDEVALQQEAQEQEANLELRRLMSEAGTVTQKVTDTIMLPPVRPLAKMASKRGISAQRASLLGAVKRRRDEKLTSSSSKIAREDEPDLIQPEKVASPQVPKSENVTSPQVPKSENVTSPQVPKSENVTSTKAKSENVTSTKAKSENVTSTKAESDSCVPLDVHKGSGLLLDYSDSDSD